jgi:tetratricopeptide (TPR) repeat protein
VSIDWGERVAWRHRSPQFDRLFAHGDFRKSVVMELQPTEDGWGRPASAGGREAWLSLPPHPNLLEAIEPWGDDRLLLRYAALDWNYNLDTASTATLATWGTQLVAVYSFLLAEVDERQLFHFANPFVEVDIGGHLRVGFRPANRRWADDGEARLIQTIGMVLLDLIGGRHPALSAIATRYIEPSAKRRSKGLQKLDIELRTAGAASDAIRSDDVFKSWRYVEEGCGWLELGDDVRAGACFRYAHARMAYKSITEWGIERAAALAAEKPGVAPEPHPRAVESTRGVASGVLIMRALTWPEAEDEGLRLESQRAFGEALGVYRRCKPGANAAALHAARARCHLRLRELGEALDYAQRAFQVRPQDVATCELLAEVLLQRRSFDQALNAVAQLLALDPQRGRAHYLRGKALFGLGRMIEAHDCFARASALDPKLLEAQLLRREVERVTGNVRQTVGKQHAPTFDIPEQLAELRETLISGDTNAAITALRDDRYARDADAQLLLARFLTFDARHHEAITVYDQLAATSHATAALVGKATALFELGRTGDALSIVEQLRDDADAAELQARALEHLGRVNEAAEAYRRFIALASSGSDLRVRAAQLALDELAKRVR